MNGANWLSENVKSFSTSVYTLRYIFAYLDEHQQHPSMQEPVTAREQLMYDGPT